MNDQRTSQAASWPRPCPVNQRRDITSQQPGTSSRRTVGAGRRFGTGVTGNACVGQVCLLMCWCRRFWRCVKSPAIWGRPAADQCIRHRQRVTESSPHANRKSASRRDPGNRNHVGWGPAARCGNSAAAATWSSASGQVAAVPLGCRPCAAMRLRGVSRALT
jgi:hypothetical protein